MSETDSSTHDAEPAATLTAGEVLRDAREASGLSIDAVAQQLKLAPRQVQALEENDFAQLPGRTFVRGFMRNYARLLRLDTEALLASLPDGHNAPALDHPSLSPTTRAMGELPAEMPTKPSSSRWAIPLALAAIVLIAAAYEFGRPLAERGRAVLADRAPPAAAPAVEAPPPVASSAQVETAQPVSQAAAEPAPAATTEAPPPAAGDTPIVFVFRGTSWIEVKDAKGAVLLSTMGYPGATHAVGGTPPLEVVLGNAEAVIVTLRGAPFDTSAYVRQNVAKFTVK